MTPLENDPLVLHDDALMDVLGGTGHPDVAPSDHDLTAALVGWRDHTRYRVFCALFNLLDPPVPSSRLKSLAYITATLGYAAVVALLVWWWLR